MLAKAGSRRNLFVPVEHGHGPCATRDKKFRLASLFCPF